MRYDTIEQCSNSDKVSSESFLIYSYSSDLALLKRAVSRTANFTRIWNELPRASRPNLSSLTLHHGTSPCPSPRDLRRLVSTSLLKAPTAPAAAHPYTNSEHQQRPDKLPAPQQQSASRTATKAVACVHRSQVQRVPGAGLGADAQPRRCVVGADVRRLEVLHPGQEGCQEAGEEGRQEAGQEGREEGALARLVPAFIYAGPRAPYRDMWKGHGPQHAADDDAACLTPTMRAVHRAAPWPTS